MASKKGQQNSKSLVGPYLILEVRHNSLRVAVSPSVGGVVEVSTSLVKSGIPFIKMTPVFSTLIFPTSNSFLPTDPNPENELSPEEALEQGFYNVQAILKHKFQQGWRFLFRRNASQLGPPHGSQSEPSFYPRVGWTPNSRNIAKITICLAFWTKLFRSRDLLCGPRTPKLVEEEKVN